MFTVLLGSVKVILWSGGLRGGKVRKRHLETSLELATARLDFF